MPDTHAAECFLVGVDDSDCSRRALDFASRRARAMGARLVVVYVIEWSPYSFNTPEENEQRHKRREEEIEQAFTNRAAIAYRSAAGHSRLGIATNQGASWKREGQTTICKTAPPAEAKLLREIAADGNLAPHIPAIYSISRTDDDATRAPRTTFI